MLRCKSCLKTIETNKAESKDITQDTVEDFNKNTCNVIFARVMSMYLMLMLRWKSCLKTIETNKAESKDATEDKVEDFKEETCNVCAYDF